VLLYSLADMEAADGWLPCEVSINRSRGYNTDRINFVITAFAVWSRSPRWVAPAGRLCCVIRVVPPQQHWTVSRFVTY